MGSGDLSASEPPPPRKATDDLNEVYSLHSPLQTTSLCTLLESIHRRSVKQPRCFTDWLCFSQQRPSTAGGSDEQPLSCSYQLYHSLEPR